MKNIFTKQLLLLISILCSFYGTYAATITSTATGGNWSATTTWSGGVLPGAGDDIIVANGATVTIDISPGITFNSITVGQGTSGILQYTTGTTVKALAVSGDLIIKSGAIFRTSTTNPGSATLHTLSVGGNITNNGTLNAQATTNSRLAITVTGNSNFTNAGATLTQLVTLTLNAAGATLDFNPSSTLTLPATGFLTITAGIFKLEGALAISNPIFATSAYTIPATAGFWLNNPNAVVTGLAGSTGAMGGTLRISSGIYNIGTTTNHSMTWSTGATIIIEGGAVNAQGKFGVSAANNIINYTQTGGIITVGISGGSNLAALASFDAGNSTSSSFTMSGGSIILTKAAANMEYRGPAAGATINITGGNLFVGSSATGASAAFKIAGATPNITLDNSSGLNPGITQNAAVGVYGDMTLNGAGIYTKGAYPLTMQGMSAVNPGNITINGTNTLTLNGSALAVNALSFVSTWGNQLITVGSGTITANELPSLTINNTFGGGTVTLPTNLSIMAGGTLSLTNGDYLVGAGGSGVLSLGTATAGTFTCIRSQGNLYAASVVYGSAVTTKSYTYNGALTQTTGAELTTSSSAAIDALTINNAALYLTLDRPINVKTSLTLTAGIVFTNSTNALWLGTSTTAGTLTGGSAASYIDGPIIRTFAAGKTATGTYTNVTLFPVGKNGIYLPTYFDAAVSASGALQLQTEGFNSNSGTNISVSGTVSQHRWEAFAVNGTDVNLINILVRISDALCTSTNKIIEATSASGVYQSITQATVFTTGLLTSGTVIPAAEFISTGYFSFGDACYPLPSVTGPKNICIGAASQFYPTAGVNIPALGTWASSDASIATVDVSGNVTGINTGSTVITFTISSSDGCNGLQTNKIVTISNCSAVPGGVGNNLISWYKGDVGLSTSNWIDQTGANTVTSSGAPAVSNFINFNPVASFSGSADYYSNTSADGWLGTTNSTTYYFVARATGAAASKVVFGRGTANSAGSSAHGGRTTSNAIFGSGTVNTNPVQGSWATSAISMARTGFNGGAGANYYIAANGNATEVASTPTTPTIAGQAPFYIGRSATSGAFWLGDIAEVIAFNNKQTVADYARVQSYLALKYGITIDQTTPTNYIASDAGTKMWDITVAGNFTKNIFGIGKDNASGLDQRISSSVANVNILTVATTNDFSSSNLDASRVSLANMSFETFADNGGAAKWFNYGNRAGFALLTKQWNVQQTGVSSNVFLQFNVDNASFDVPALLSGSDYYLVTDPNGDNDYSDGSIYTLINTSGSLWSTNTGIPLNNGCVFTIATTSNIKGPGGVTDNLTLWLKADNISGASNGNPVSSWTNSVPGITAPTGASLGASLPTYIAGSDAAKPANFNPSVYFGGANNLVFSDLAFNTGLASNKNLFTAFIVSGIDNLTASTNPNFICQPTGQGNTAIGVETNSGNNRLLIAPSWGIAGSTSSINSVKTDSTNIFSYQYAGSAAGSTSINGLIYPGVTDAGGNTFAINSTLGGNGNINYAPTFLNGNIQELVMYNTASLSAIKTQQINSYLALKYGITLNQNTPTDYLASDGSKIWNATAAAAGFSHNIFGIGRDDSSTLNQKVARSVNTQNIVTIGLPQVIAFTNVFDFTTSNQGRGYVSWSNNLSFETVADNGGTATWNNTVVQSRYRTLNREWQVQETGTVGQVVLQFNMTDPNFTIPSLLTGTNYFLLITDASGNYNTASVIALANTAPGMWSTVITPSTPIDFTNGNRFTLATYDPSIIQNKVCPGGVGEANGMQLWLKADAGINATGSNINTWANQAQPLVIPMTSEAHSLIGTPTIITNNFNYNPSVVLDGSSNLSGQMTNTPPIGTAISFAVAKGVATGNIGGILSINGQNGNILVNSSGAYGTDANGAFYYSSTPTAIANTPYVVAADYTNFSIFNSTVRLNGRASAGGTNATLAYPSANGVFNIGLRNDRFNGNIAEVVYYISNNSITEAQKHRIESYLALKYAITLDNSAGGTAGNYTLSNNKDVWNASVNSNYHRQVIALARDDSSALLQKQSRTQDDSLRVFVGNALAASNQANANTISNNYSSIVIGNDGGRLRSVYGISKPPTIYSRLERTWKVTNTKFSNSFGIEIMWDSIGTFNISDLRLLVSNSPDFTNATVYSSYDVNFYIGSIIVTGINNSIIPVDSTKYITIGSVSMFTPLTVVLKDFTAAAVYNKWVKLNWQTTTESDNDHFTVEKSIDANTWEAVATIPGAGNTNTEKNYDALDQQPYAGTSYYRLKQTDANGRFTVSPVQKVRIEKNTAGVSVFPNPVNNRLTIQASAADLKNIKIFNMAGQDITSMVKTIDNTGTSVILDTSAIPAGIYSVKTASAITKIIKQ